jgi:hypothetical protein
VESGKGAGSSCKCMWGNLNQWRSRRLYREQVMRMVLEGQIAYLEKLVARGEATSWVLQTMEDDKALLRELTGA